jgi:hypothetical protein
LERLDLSLSNGGVPTLAQRFAQQAFDTLTGGLQTAVSVAVYDVDRVQEFVRSVRTVYDSTLSALTNKTQAGRQIEHCDCAEIPAYVLPTISDGVEFFYRPVRFGRSKQKQEHSSWGCWKQKKPQHPTSQTAAPVFK